MELTETEVGDYFKPSDLMIGKTVNIYGRNFLIYDCDMFTKTFYAKNFGVSSFEPVDIQATQSEYPKMVNLSQGERQNHDENILGNSSIQWIWHIGRFSTKLSTSSTGTTEERLCEINGE